MVAGLALIIAVLGRPTNGDRHALDLYVRVYLQRLQRIQISIGFVRQYLSYQVTYCFFGFDADCCLLVGVELRDGGSCKLF